MTIQSEILLAQTYRGFKVLEVHEKSTVFSKQTLNSGIASSLSEAIRTGDEELMGAVLATLSAAMIQGGWDKAPGAYCMKHNGFMIGVLGLYTSNGIKSDLTLTVRTNHSLR